MTHAYFCLYHTLSNMLIRRVRHAVAAYGSAAQVGRLPGARPATAGAAGASTRQACQP